MKKHTHLSWPLGPTIFQINFITLLGCGGGVEVEYYHFIFWGEMPVTFGSEWWNCVFGGIVTVGWKASE